AFAQGAPAASPPPPINISGAPPARPSAGPLPASKQAIALGHEGLKLMELGEYEQALTLFMQAEQLAHSPVFLIYQARAAWWLGRYEAALGLYQTCSDERLDEQSPVLWQQTVLEARRERARLAEVIPVIELSFAGQVRAPLRVSIRRQTGDDGALGRTSTADWPTVEQRRIKLDPGQYSITVRDGAERVVRQALRARPGSRIQARFVFPASPVKGTPRAPSPPVPSGTTKLRWGAYAAWSSGSALLIGGVVAGSMSMMLAQDVLSKCSGDVCPAEEQIRVARAQRLGRLAAAGIVSGLVGEVAGTVLWLWDRHETRLQLATQGTGLMVQGKF
ncbi:MAG TPA: tetratricopeptide repeat protein, partial [Polyangiaceae bacterium]|nr:tetratricopeptide repeat protein [Polyangiaceae bacterium]